MSHVNNERYLSGANELFDECVDEQDMEGARTVIAQLHRDGFSDEARDLEAQLLDTSISSFAAKPTVMDSFAKVQESVKKLEDIMKEDQYPRNAEGLKIVDTNTFLK